MSYADKVFKENVKDILENGVWDTDMEVRPRWLDGTPAHTVKKFCIVNRYDLSMDMAEKIQQNRRPSFAYLGQLGGRRRNDRQSIRLSARR